MKKTIKILAAVVALFFYANSFAQYRIPSLGYNVDSMRNYIKSLNPIAYEEEDVKSENDLLLKSAFDHYNLGIVCTEGFCYNIILTIRDTVSLDYFVDFFDKNWTSLGHGNWKYVDYKHNNATSIASLKVKNNIVSISVYWEKFKKEEEVGSK